MAAAKSAPPTDAAALTATLARLLAGLAGLENRSLGGRARLCVALSGGRDSVVLLHALARLLAAVPMRGGIELRALHVNHGLSAHADAWSAFCAELCRSLAVPLDIVRVSVAGDSGEGLEGAARRARHAAFARCDADWLVLAHHRADQAETLLLNLLRGAGLAGAAAMRAERTQRGGPRLLRPLLGLSRSAIDDYARANALAWVDDESNADTYLRRNYLRREVMPRLASVFPQAESSLARAAEHFAEGAQLLDELAAIDRAALRLASGRLALAGFNALAADHPPRARNLLRFVWLAAGLRAPDRRWIAEALRQLANTDALAEICVATRDGELRVYRGEIHIVAATTTRGAEAPAVALRWSGEDELPWAGGRLRFVGARGTGIARRCLAGSEVMIGARQGGERLQPDVRRPRRSLRNLLQEAALPPWERRRLPLLSIDGELAWVGAIGIDARFACAADEDGVLPVWDADYAPSENAAP